MNIVNFTPISAFTGGILIGFAVFVFFIFNGRMAGVSNIASNAIMQNSNRLENFLFLFGLFFGPIVYSIFKNEIVSNMTSSIFLIVIAGLLVGFGTKIGNGCTSGHGICGISRISLRSIIATISFIITGMLTVFIFGAS
tara:strand:+ start:481 stop:897 length:417 start_codon:yes stop_codon:yes gene_type:complete